jgi:hypothetical protein
VVEKPWTWLAGPKPAESVTEQTVESPRKAGGGTRSRGWKLLAKVDVTDDIAKRDENPGRWSRGKGGGRMVKEL